MSRHAPASAAGVEGIDFVANHAEIGGGEVMLLRMATTARDLGVDVRVVGPDYDNALGDAAGAAGLAYVPVPGGDRRAYAVHLLALARTWRTRLVWCNGLVPALATGRCRAPRVVHLHQRPSPRQAQLLRFAGGRPVALVAPSPFLARHVPGARVLENWTEAADATTRDVLIAPPVTIGFIGRLSPIKGVDVLADAMAMLARDAPDRYALVLAGDNRFVPPHDIAALDARLDACASITTRLGWVEPDTFFAQVDVAVVPSSWEEPFGLVAAQAMARRVPVIVTDSGALVDIVGDDHPWIVPRTDPAALAAMIEAVVADPARARAVAAESRARWDARFSPRSGARRFARLLRDLGVAAHQPDADALAPSSPQIAPTTLAPADPAPAGRAPITSAVFVSGMKKSGTNWVANLLDTHPRVGVVDELHLELLHDALIGIPEDQTPISRAAIDAAWPALARELLEQQRRAHVPELPSGAVLVDHTPGWATRHLGDAARYVHVVRDVRDVIVSDAFHSMRGHEYPADVEAAQRAHIDEWLSDPWYFRTHPQALLHPAEVDRLARTWVDIVRSAHALATDHPDTVRIIRYEDLHADPVGERDRLLRFVGLDPRHGSAELPQNVQPAFGSRGEDPHAFYRKGVVGDHRAYFTPALTAIVEPIAGDLLAELGYD